LKFPPKLCGLCGTKHAPGEAHRSKKVGGFKENFKRVGGGYIHVIDTITNKYLGLKKGSITSHRSSSRAPRLKIQP
jgi:hypothetical protein